MGGHAAAHKSGLWPAASVIARRSIHPAPLPGPGPASQPDRSTPRRMAPITEALLVRRAEHNDGRLSSLQEIALHQQGIERIELLNQLCRHLRILYLQNNLICRIERLNRLKVRGRGAATGTPPLPPLRGAPSPALPRRSWRCSTWRSTTSSACRTCSAARRCAAWISPSTSSTTPACSRCAGWAGHLGAEPHDYGRTVAPHTATWQRCPSTAPAHRGMAWHRSQPPCLWSVATDRPTPSSAAPLPAGCTPLSLAPSAACRRTNTWRSCTCWATPAPSGPATGPMSSACCRACADSMASRWVRCRTQV